MPKGSVITEELFRTVKQLQKIHEGSQAEQIAPLVCREATVIRKIMKCDTWEDYCEYKKAKAEKERKRAEKRRQAEEPAEEQVPGQIRMDLVPTEEKPEMSETTKMMRFLAGRFDVLEKSQAVGVEMLNMKLEKLNDTMSMILRAIRKE